MVIAKNYFTLTIPLLVESLDWFKKKNWMELSLKLYYNILHIILNSMLKQPY